MARYGTALWRISLDSYLTYSNARTTAKFVRVMIRSAMDKSAGVQFATQHFEHDDGGRRCLL